MRWKELEKQVSKLPPAPHYFQALEQLKWDKGEELSHNIQICCDFLDKDGSQGSLIDKRRVEHVWQETAEPLADILEPVFLERHGMLKAEDKKELGVQCAGQAIQKLYDSLTDVAGLDNASKILHLRFPKLFVTTDEAIRKYWTEEVGLARAVWHQGERAVPGLRLYLYIPALRQRPSRGRHYDPRY